MDPTFKTGDYLIVDEITYSFRTPERGSILIFKYPINPKKSFIKRVIGSYYLLHIYVAQNYHREKVPVEKNE